MNFLLRSFTWITLIAVVAFATGCSSEGGGDDAATEETTETTTPAVQPTPQVAPPAVQPAVTPQVQASQAQGVEYTSHYVCPNYCKGSGSETDGGTCPVCSSAYVHNSNSSFHQQQQQQQLQVQPQNPTGN